MKLIYTFFVIFILMNIFITAPTFAQSNTGGTSDFAGPSTTLGATILKLIIVSVKVIAIGYFVIRLTINGIQLFFIASTAQDKADNKNNLKWTFIYAVGALLGIELFSIAMGI